MHQIVEGDGLRTQFAYAPAVSMSATQDGPTTVVMIFPSSILRPDGRSRMTRITFGNVLDFRWKEFELGLSPKGPPDTRFALIEITDSETIGAFIAEGKIRRARGVTRESELRHYRIAFDEHGTYDVVCTELDVVLDNGHAS